MGGLGAQISWLGSNSESAFTPDELSSHADELKTQHC